MGAFVKVEGIQVGQSPAAVCLASCCGGDLVVTVLCGVNTLSLGHTSHFILAATLGSRWAGRGHLPTYRHRSLWTGPSCSLLYCRLPVLMWGLSVVEWGSEPRLLVPRCSHPRSLMPGPLLFLWHILSQSERFVSLQVFDIILDVKCHGIKFLSILFQAHWYQGERLSLILSWTKWNCKYLIIFDL